MTSEVTVTSHNSCYR